MTTPGFVDVLVLGGGTSGAVLAGRLAELTDASVLVLEAGPDYGPLRSGQWPAELLDASQLPLTHDWGYTSGSQIAGRVIRFQRARVIGGCSSHNGCQIAIGHRLDYDGWAARGNQGWAADDLRPYIAAAKERLCVRAVADEELTPFGRASLDAMLAAGLPRARDLTDPDEDFGVAPNPANVVRGIVCAGVYGSPAILLRSGIGDPADLAQLDVRPVHALPGVGRNLQDHPAVELRFAGTPELERRSRAFAARAFHPEEQLIAKLRSSRCPAAFDLHLYTQGGARRQEPDRWIWTYTAAVLTPGSRGRLRLRSPDPGAAPIIEHGFLADLNGEDLGLLAEAFTYAREITKRPELSALLGQETEPGATVGSAEEAGAWLRRSVGHAHHSAGTCMMGPQTDPMAVVDQSARIHGLTGGYIADAAIMPVVPHANTNLPAAVVAERVAALLAHDRASNQ